MNKVKISFSLGLERYWYWVIGYWAIFTDIG